MVDILDPIGLSRPPWPGFVPLQLKPERNMHLALVKYKPGKG
jgi:hypothetical protein